MSDAPPQPPVASADAVAAVPVLTTSEAPTHTRANWLNTASEISQILASVGVVIPLLYVGL